MYKEHFGLHQEPFRSTFEGLGIYVGPQQATVISRLTKALGTLDAVATVTGPVGIGKTTLVSRALEVAAPERRVAHIGRMRLAPDEVLELLLEKFGVSRQPVGTIQRFATFKRLLDECAGNRTRAIIVVEDARRIGLDALIELEAMTAADGNVSSSANIVLMGDRELPAFLADASLARLRQRTRTRQALEPYTVDELHDYLKHCVHLAGGEFDAIFERGSIETLHHCSEGIPRIVNNICETALTEAADENAVRVSVELLQAIARDVYGIESAAPAQTIDASDDDVAADEDDLEVDDEFSSAGEFVPDDAGPPDCEDEGQPSVDDERARSTVPSLSLVTAIPPYDPGDAQEECASEGSHFVPAEESRMDAAPDSAMPEPARDELPDPDALFDDEPLEETGSDDEVRLQAVADIGNNSTAIDADDESYDPYASAPRVEEQVVEQRGPSADVEPEPEAEPAVEPESPVAEPMAAELDPDPAPESEPEESPELESSATEPAAAQLDPAPAPESEPEESPEFEPAAAEPVASKVDPEPAPESEPEESPELGPTPAAPAAAELDPESASESEPGEPPGIEPAAAEPVAAEVETETAPDIEPELEESPAHGSPAAEPVATDADTAAATPDLVATVADDDAIPVLDVAMPEAVHDRDEPSPTAAAQTVDPAPGAEDPIPVVEPETPAPGAGEERVQQPVAQETEPSSDEGEDAVPVLELETGDGETPVTEAEVVSNGTAARSDDGVPVLTESMDVAEPVTEPAKAANTQAIEPEPVRDESNIDTMTPEAEELIGALDELELAISSANEPDATPASAKDVADAAKDVPDITLDRNLAQPEPQKTDINRWQEELANARSLEEMSDLLAETVFGDQEFDRIAAEVTKNAPPGAVEAEPVPAVAEPAPKTAAEPAEDFAIELEPEAQLVPTGGEDQRGATGGFDLSMSKRFELLKSLGSSVANIAQNDANIMEITLGEDAPPPDADTDAAPDPIESQIDTEITQSRLALTKADMKKLEKKSAVPEEPEPEKQSNGFFGLFKRSSK